jgi:hypothetical protein
MLEIILMKEMEKKDGVEGMNGNGQVSMTSSSQFQWNSSLLIPEILGLDFKGLIPSFCHCLSLDRLLIVFLTLIFLIY